MSEPTKYGLYKDARGTYRYRLKTAFGVRTISLKCSELKLAEKRARRIRVEWMEDNRLNAELLQIMLCGKKIKCLPAVEKWIDSLRREGNLKPATLQSYQTTAEAFIYQMKLNTSFPTAATPEHVNRFVNSVDKTKVSTRRKRLVILQMWFDFCVNQRFSAHNPARTIRRVSHAGLSHEQKETEHKQPFTPEEIERLMRQLDKEIVEIEAQLASFGELAFRKYSTQESLRQAIAARRFWRVAVPIALHTGLRFGDIACLEWATMGKPNTVAVWTEKKDKRVEIPRALELQRAIEQIALVDPLRCFPNERRVHLSPQRARFPKQFHGLLRRAGISGRSFHCLRSTFAINFYQQCRANGQDHETALENVRELLGHAAATTTKEHYLSTLQPNAQSVVPSVPETA